MADLKVKAVSSGYYGGQYRYPDTASASFNLDKAEDFSFNWMEAIGWEPAKKDPLDHDGDGKKGGTAPAVDDDGKPELSERDKLKAEATELKIEFAANIRTDKLKELVEAKKAENAEPAGDDLTDEDKILKAMEISGRTDEMTVEEADAILQAAAESNDI